LIDFSPDYLFTGWLARKARIIGFFADKIKDIPFLRHGNNPKNCYETKA